MLCELTGEAGLPNGVLNVVHGTGPNVGAAAEPSHIRSPLLRTRLTLQA